MKTIDENTFDNIYCELKASMRELNVRNQTFEQAVNEKENSIVLAKLKARCGEMMLYIGGISETLRLIGFNVEFDIQSTKIDTHYYNNVKIS